MSHCFQSWPLHIYCKHETIRTEIRSQAALLALRQRKMEITTHTGNEGGEAANSEVLLLRMRQTNTAFFALVGRRRRPAAHALSVALGACALIYLHSIAARATQPASCTAHERIVFAEPPHRSMHGSLLRPRSSQSACVFSFFSDYGTELLQNACALRNSFQNKTNSVA